MLVVKEGNLFDHLEPPCILVHGCNAQGRMNFGFAKEVRHRFPYAYLSYVQAHREERFTPGDLQIVVCGHVHVCHAITQRYYGKDPDVVYVDYAAVEKCLKEVAQYAEIIQLPVHLPFIGAGVAHGDHERLMDIFKQTLDGVSATLWLHTPTRPIRRTDT